MRITTNIISIVGHIFLTGLIIVLSWMGLFVYYAFSLVFGRLLSIFFPSIDKR